MTGGIKSAVVAAEVWQRSSDDAGAASAAVVCLRYSTGVYRVFVGGEFVVSSTTFIIAGESVEVTEVDTDAVVGMLTAPLDTSPQPLTTEWFVSIGLKPVATEFAIEKAAQKYVRRLLSGLTSAAYTDIGWEPAAGWKRLYDGALSVQTWNANVRRDRAVQKIAQLEATIEADQTVGSFDDSDSDYAARRRRKLELKRQKRELEQAHGGDNA